MAKRNPSTLGIWGPEGTRVKSKSFIANLHKWNREAEAAGKAVSVFPSLCDPFEDRPELDPWRREMFQAIDECPWVRLLLLTKRPENVPRMWPLWEISQELYDKTIPNVREEVRESIARQWHYRRNVWLGTSISDQPTADKAVPELLKCRDLSPVLFLSAEPLLGPVDLTRLDWRGDRLNPLDTRNDMAAPNVDWVIAGGESGPGARPMHPDWARSLRDQCQAAGVPFFWKQWGEWAPTCERRCEDRVVYADGRSCEFSKEAIMAEERRSGIDHNRFHPQCMYRVGKKDAGRMLDGREWDEFPEADHV